MADLIYIVKRIVYSIWLCDDTIRIKRWPETEDKYIHKLNMRISYHNIDNRAGYDEDCDFMEVVLIELELPKMKNTLLKEDAALVSLLYRREDAIDRIEKILPIKLERARKGIRKAMNWEERTRYYVEESRAEGRQKAGEKARRKVSL